MRKRQGHDGDYVLGVGYRGKPTHHLIVKQDDGFFYINRKKYGNNGQLEEVRPTPHGAHGPATHSLLGGGPERRRRVPQPQSPG